MGVDHASQTLITEGFLDWETGKSSARLEEIEARATHPEIEVAAYGKHTVADGLRFESPEGKGPEKP